MSEPSLHDPLVSIVIPSHNRPKECLRAVKSALNQTWEKLEIIVVDDASREDMTLFEEFVHSHNQAETGANPQLSKKNIQWVRLTENRGACHARNIGLQKAQGEYINFLDDDDELYPEKIEKQLRVFADSNDPDLAVVTSHMNDARSGDERLTFNHHRGRIYPDILASWFVKGIHTSLFKREALMATGGFDEKLEANQEYDLMIRLMEHHTLDYVDEALCIAHRSRDQISLNFGKKRRGARYLFHKHTGRFKAEGSSFYLKMWIKYRLLDVRFWVGERFGERAYRLLTPK